MIGTTEWSAALMRDQLELYRRMWVLRLLDMALEELRIEGLTSGPVHSAFGQEAVAIGTTAALRPGDNVTTTLAHLEHARQVGLSLPLGRVIAEVIDEEGPLAADDYGHGSSSPADTLGQSPLWAAGNAYSQWAAGEGGVTLCFIGTGDANSADFNEAANIAMSWQLPMVIVVESIRQSCGAHDDGHPQASHGLPVRSVAGNDVEAVRDAVAEAVQRAGAGAGPTVVEAVTYRTNHVAASDGDCELASPDQVLDPLVFARQRLIDGGVSASRLYEVERQARHLVAEAESFGKAMSRGVEMAPVRRPEAWRAAS